MGFEFETERIRRDRELADVLGVTSGFKRDFGVGSEIELAKISIPIAAYDPTGGTKISGGQRDSSSGSYSSRPRNVTGHPIDWAKRDAEEAERRRRREEERRRELEEERLRKIKAREDWEERVQFDKGPVFSEKEKTKIGWRL
jgi:hypothetical protein